MTKARNAQLRWMRSTSCSAAAVLCLLLAGCGDDADPLQAAQEDLRRHDPAAAQIHLGQALLRQPHSGLARFLLGQLLFDKGEFATAAIELAKARSAGHPADQVLPVLAQAHLGQGDAAAVLKLAPQAEQLPSTARADLLTSMAMAHFRLGAQAQGQAALDAALDLNPQQARARILRAQRLAAAGDPASARALSEATVRDSPQDVQAWLAHAQLLAVDEGSADLAIAAFRKALALSADAIQARTGLLTLLMQRKDFTGASRELAALRERNPSHPAVGYFDTMLALQQGDTSAARLAADRLVSAAPTNARFSRLAAAVSLETGQLSKAASQLTAALQANPADPGLRRLLALTLVRNGDGLQALESLQPLIKPGSKDAEALALAGVAALQTGERARADDYFAAAARHQPKDNPRLRATLAMWQSTRSDAPASLDQLQALAQGDSGNTYDLALVSARIQRQDFAGAQRALDGLAHKNARDPMVPMLRGEIRLRQGDRAAARASFDQALAQAPTFLPAASALAELDLHEQRVDQARARFAALLKRDPGNAGTLLAMARLERMAKGPPEEVSRLLAEAVRADPLQLVPRLTLIEHELHQGHARAALGAADDAVQAIPGEPRLLWAQARACLAAQDHQRAIQVLGRLAGAQSKSPEPLRQLARVQMALKQTDAARQSLKKAVDLDGRGSESWVDLARLEIGAGRLDEARRIASRLQKDHRDQPTGFQLAGEAAAAGGQWVEAEQAYAAALARRRDDSLAAIGLHAVLLRAGRAAQAEQLAARWLREHPKDAEFMQHLGDRALLARDYAAAERHYRAVLLLHPDSAVTLNNLAWTSHHLGRTEALSYAERAVQARPAEASFVDTLARLHAANGHWPIALQHAARAVELAPGIPGYRLTLAQMYLRAGDRVQARGQLEVLGSLRLDSEEQAGLQAIRQQL